jgi:hypothetical protein
MYSPPIGMGSYPGAAAIGRVGDDLAGSGTEEDVDRDRRRVGLVGVDDLARSAT